MGWNQWVVIISISPLIKFIGQFERDTTTTNGFSSNTSSGLTNFNKYGQTQNPDSGNTLSMSKSSSSFYKYLSGGKGPIRYILKVLYQLI